MTQILVNDMVPKLESWAKEILAGTLEGDTLAKTLNGMSILTNPRPINTYVLRREIAEMCIRDSNFSTFLGRPGLYLEDLYVKPEMRGKLSLIHI